MARKVRNKILDTRSAREKLSKRGKPYYTAIGKGLHLGYRKGKTARTWLLRRHVDGSKYAFETLGAADDEADADGVTVLNFWQAQELARAKANIKTARSGPYTVADAIADYVKHLDGKATAYDVEKRLAANVPPELANMEAAKVTEEILRDWRNEVAKALPRLRTTPGEKQQYREVDLADEDVARKRKVSANRCLSQLKRALWLARKKFASDGAWRTAELFRGVEAARIRYLTVKEAQRLVNVCEGSFRVLVQAALQTGCRYGELARLDVEDFNPDSGTLAIRRTKTGKARHVFLTDEGQQFFRQITAGRLGGDRLLGHEWRKSQQIRPMKAACLKAKIKPLGFHQLRHTWASLAVMAGMPLMAVAKNLGHSDTRMVEKHYGHLAPSYVANEVRTKAPKFGFKPTNVESIR